MKNLVFDTLSRCVLTKMKLYFRYFEGHNLFQFSIRNEAILSSQFCTLRLMYRDDSETQKVKFCNKYFNMVFFSISKKELSFF
jgi:hypothetical protein